MGFLLQDLNRQTLRAPVNPLDRATVVSICPLYIDEIKPTLQPSRFVVPPGSYHNPTVAVVEPSSWWRELDPEQPLLEIPVSAIAIAESIIRDYCVGLLACDMDGAMPGFFSIPGIVDLNRVRREYTHMLERANQKQKNWYQALSRLADALWTRTQGNPMAISDTMRIAAKELGLEKPWMKDFTVAEIQLKPCPACGELRSDEFPVCRHCKTVIDKKRFDELGLSSAQ